eukprot:1634527-Pleurochrysis_carterae.AAC.1
MSPEGTMSAEEGAAAAGAAAVDAAAAGRSGSHGGRGARNDGVGGGDGRRSCNRLYITNFSERNVIFGTRDSRGRAHGGNALRGCACA